MASSNDGKFISIGFIGAGSMATAIAKGLIDAGITSPSTTYFSDQNESKLAELGNLIGCKNFSTDNKYVAANVQVIVLAVKPHIVPIVMKDIKSNSKVSRGESLVISIAAGVTIAKIVGDIPSLRVVRVMPNTPCLVGATAAAYCRGGAATQADADLTKLLFSAVGVAREVEEKYLDAITGLSGSGPAYIFVLIEALADGGVRAGLSRSLAQTMAAQTVFGAAKMVLETGKHPGQLKDAVASPGGTTIAGLHVLEKAGFRGILMDAVLAATNRAAELGMPKSKL